MPFYVSPSGSDSNPGTLAQPFHTLARAQSVVRGSSDKTVVLRGGTYSLSSDWSFDGSDNGEIWTPYPGELPIIDGAGAHHVYIAANSFTLNGLKYQNTSARTIELKDCSNLTLRWNQIYGATVNAIYGPNLQNSIIDSNTIDGVSNSEGAIQLFYGPSNNKISRNLIQNTNGAAIFVGDGASDPPLNNNVIDRNLLINNMQAWEDMGAIYLDDRTGRGSGNYITNNVILGLGSGSSSSVKGIYSDDFNSNVTISGNIVGRGNYFAAFQVHGGNNNKISNNIADLTGGSAYVGFYQSTNLGSIGMSSNEFAKNIVYSDSTFSDRIWKDGHASPDANLNNHNNLYYSGTGASIPYTTEITDGAPVFANPQFTNPSANDYSMPGGSAFFGTVGGTAFVTDQGPAANPYTSPGAPVINSFSANPAAVSASGVNSTLSWNTGGDPATSITLTPQGGSAITVTGSTSYSVAVTGTLTYTLAVTNGSGTTQGTVTVSIASSGGSGSGTGTGGTGGTGGAGSGSGPTAPTIASYTSTATTVTLGGSATLNWSITGTTTAAYVNGALQAGTSLSVSPTATTTYRLTVFNGLASSSQDITITVNSEASENIEYHQVRRGDRHGAGVQFQMSDGTGTAGQLCGFLVDGTSTAINIDPSLLSSDGSTLRIQPSSLAGGIYGQTPRGVVNGANRYFRLDYTPASVYMWLVRNGIEQKPPVDGGSTNPGGEYIIRGSEIEYVTPPSGTDWHYVKYFTDSIATPPHRVSATAYLTSAHHVDPHSDQWGAGAGFNDVVSLFSSPSWFHDSSTWDKRTDTHTMSATELATLDNGSLYLLLEQYHLGNFGGTGPIPWDDEFWVYDAYISVAMSDGTTQIWRPTLYGTQATAGGVTNPQNVLDQDASSYAVILATSYAAGGYDGTALGLSGWTRVS